MPLPSSWPGVNNTAGWSAAAETAPSTKLSPGWNGSPAGRCWGTSPPAPPTTSPRAWDFPGIPWRPPRLPPLVSPSPATSDGSAAGASPILPPSVPLPMFHTPRTSGPKTCLDGWLIYLKEWGNWANSAASIWRLKRNTPSFRTAFSLARWPIPSPLPVTAAPLPAR